MTDAKEFKTVLNIAKRICEFIAGEHSSVFRRITGATFGISTSIVTVRPFEKSPGLENLEERTDALFQDLKEKGAKELTVKLFSGGMKCTYFYNEKGKSIDQVKDVLPEGSLFRVDMGGRKDLFLRDTELFISELGPIISPLLDTTTRLDLFLNGESFSFKK